MMKNKKEHKMALPELRFPEFRDSEGWSETTLGAISSITNGKANVQDHIEGGKYPLFDRSDVIKSTNNYLFDCEAVIIPGEGMRFIPKYYVGKFNLHQRAYALKDFSCIGLYVYYQMEHSSTLLSVKAVKSTVLSLRLPILLNFPVLIPKKPKEQQKIADCFCSLDDLISAVVDKIDVLKEHKKGLMQRLFPTEGSTVPTLRFPEFQSAPEWKEATLSGVCEKIGDGLHGTPEYDENGVYYFVNGNNIKEGKLTLNGGTKMVSEYIANQNDKQISHKTVLMSINGTIGNVALYNYEKIMLSKSVAYLTVDTANECFVFYYLQTKTVQQQFCNSLTGSTIKNLGLEGIRNTLIYIPSPEEQKKIADCLTTIDNLIIAQSDRLKQLKAHKKGLMQQLFPKV